MTTGNQDNAARPVDLTNCDREPLHIIGGVQDFGCLISVTSDWIVNHASRNVSQYLAVEAEAIVGAPLNGLFCADAIHAIRTRIQMLSAPNSVERVFGLALRDGSDQTFDLALYRSGRSFVMECQPHELSAHADHVASVRSIMDRLQNMQDAADICDTAAWFLKNLSGFDRVMVYRFAHDGSGEVVSEAAEADLDPYLGLHYPASDIPKQARELYKRNLLRIIADVDSAVSPVIPVASPEGEPLDLTLSAIRAVSPIHLEYLRNMGVQASMSVSIMRRGKLWGLFACHHYSPRILPYDLRSAIELFGQMFSFALDRAETDAAAAQSARARDFHDTLMTQLAEGAALVERFGIVAESVADVIKCDGVALWTDDRCQTSGNTPSPEQLRGLVRFLNTAGTGRIFSTSGLGAIYPRGQEFAAVAAGVLAIPVSRRPRDYLLLFRREIARSVTWAGNPDKPAEVGPNGIRLTPRKSFETWKQIVRGQSDEWTEGDIEIAENLRVTLLEVVLRMIDEANAERARTRDQQEILIAELNHRVRNILNLIRGLISQTGKHTETIDQFVEVVTGRVQALARAHDQITLENWSPASLMSLIQVETDAYLGDAASRIEVVGHDMLLTPRAFTTLSLVIHELATNSMKYGALSVDRGRVSIEIAQKPEGALSLNWTESDGPVVSSPSRRGFGSTIIERSIPYELGGEAKVEYPPTGLVARFSLPGDVVAGTGSGDNKTRRIGDSSGSEIDPATVKIDGGVLVVEDNIIIAMDVQSGLAALGAHPVHIAADTQSAFEILNVHPVVLAVIDVNLGKDTSAPIAAHLHENGIPFVFSTGYGEGDALVQQYSDVPVLTKPFGRTDLVGVVARVSAGR